MHIGKTYAVSCNAIYSWCAYAVGTIARQVAISQIIGYQYNDIGLLVLGNGCKGEYG